MLTLANHATRQIDRLTCWITLFSRRKDTSKTLSERQLALTLSRERKKTIAKSPKRVTLSSSKPQPIRQTISYRPRSGLSSPLQHPEVSVLTLCPGSIKINNMEHPDLNGSCIPYRATKGPLRTPIISSFFPLSFSLFLFLVFCTVAKLCVLYFYSFSLFSPLSSFDLDF